MYNTSNCNLLEKVLFVLVSIGETHNKIPCKKVDKFVHGPYEM